MKDPVRVLIVDDSMFMRRAVERMLSDSPAINVVGAATNGRDAVDLACSLQPDVIVMDVNMPELNGLEAVEQIMRRCPAPVLMLSTLTQSGAATTIQALELGAVDFIDKSSAGGWMDIYALAPVLRDKILAVARAGVSAAPSAEALRGPYKSPPPPPRERPSSAGADFDLIAIGASTGGPRALTEILPRLPGDLEVGIVVAQHMPPGFTATLASRLNDRCALEVREARNGDLITPGTILVAPGGEQMRVERKDSALRVQVSPNTAELLHHPSVDVLLESVAVAAGSRAVGVILTGMGDDGAEGLQKMKDAGAWTICESSKTAVIYGMPRAASAAAEQILPLDEIAQALIQLCGAADSDQRRAR